MSRSFYSFTIILWAPTWCINIDSANIYIIGLVFFMWNERILNLYFHTYLSRACFKDSPSIRSSIFPSSILIPPVFKNRFLKIFFCFSKNIYLYYLKTLPRPQWTKKVQFRAFTMFASKTKINVFWKKILVEGLRKGTRSEEKISKNIDFWLWGNNHATITQM